MGRELCKRAGHESAHEPGKACLWGILQTLSTLDKKKGENAMHQSISRSRLVLGLTQTAEAFEALEVNANDYDLS